MGDLRLRLSRAGEPIMMSNRKCQVIGVTHMRYGNRAHCHRESLRVFTVFFLIITSSCAIDAKRESPPGESGSASHEEHRDRTVAEIWTEVANYHELEKDNIAFVERLLEELGDDSTVLSKDRQSRLHDSLDLYLKQFASRFKAGSKYPEKYCYWIAWLISNGIKRTPPGREKAEIIRASYEIFVDRVILDANVRLLQKKGVENYARHIETIESRSTRAREVLLSFYSNLHDDFLFPAFNDPMSKELRTYCMERTRRAVSVPLVTSPKRLEWYFRDICKFTAYWMTLRTIWKEYHRTEEWGYMSSGASTPSTAPGKWPIDVSFSPDHDFNRLKAEEERRKAKKKEKQGQ